MPIRFFLRHGFWLVLGLLMGSCIAATLPAGLAEFQLDSLRDSSGTLTLSDVQVSTFSPQPSGKLSAGYTRDVYWLRLTLRNRASALGLHNCI